MMLKFSLTPAPQSRRPEGCQAGGETQKHRTGSTCSCHSFYNIPDANTPWQDTEHFIHDCTCQWKERDHKAMADQPLSLSTSQAGLSPFLRLPPPPHHSPVTAVRGNGRTWSVVAWGSSSAASLCAPGTLISLAAP